jgi:NAD-dependent oxidoreductase involved in siderophore biosynthesis
MTTRDAMISAGVLIATSFVLITVGVMLRRSGSLDIGEAIVSLSFPVSMLVSMPFGMMKGQPWRAQALVLGVTFALLIAAGYLSILI